MTQAWTLRLWFVAAIAMAIGSSTGCTVTQGARETLAYSDSMNDFVLGWRNRAWAKRAWREKEVEYCNQPFLDDFGQGFQDGYIDAAEGGAQCSPALPPRKYWSWKYQTAEGQGKTAAWYAGYPAGARAAEEEGAHLWSEIQISESLRQEYQLGHDAPYPYPMNLYDVEQCCPQLPYDGQIVPVDGVPVEALPHIGSGTNTSSGGDGTGPRMSRLTPPPKSVLRGR
jgi:hypothetical protein